MRLLLSRIIALFAAPVILPVTAARNCGIPSIEPELTDMNIIGGRIARPGSWPWHVGLYRKRYLYTTRWNYSSQFCAGALIDQKTVVTSAHCLIYPAETIQVHLGAHLRLTRDKGEEIIDVQHYCSYPTFNGGNVDDIGIIKLKRPVTYTETISQICLPDKNDEIRISEDEVYVTGWGYTSGYVNGQQSNELKQVKQHIITKEECRTMRSMNVDKVICSKHDLGSSCTGDSGGPVVLERNGHWQLQGVVSGGPPICGTPDWPMYHTELAKYRDYIDRYRAARDPVNTPGLCKS